MHSGGGKYSLVIALPGCACTHLFRQTFRGVTNLRKFRVYTLLNLSAPAKAPLRGYVFFFLFKPKRPLSHAPPGRFWLILDQFWNIFKQF